MNNLKTLKNRIKQLKVKYSNKKHKMSKKMSDSTFNLIMIITHIVLLLCGITALVLIPVLVVL